MFTYKLIKSYGFYYNYTVCKCILVNYHNPSSGIGNMDKMEHVQGRCFTKILNLNFARSPKQTSNVAIYSNFPPPYIYKIIKSPIEYIATLFEVQNGLDK